MATSAILSLVASGLALVLHLIPSRKTSSASSTSPSASTDPFAALPGLPGHPILNMLTGIFAAPAAPAPQPAPTPPALNAARIAAFVEQIKADPASMELLKKLL